MNRNFEAIREPEKGIQQENDKTSLPFSGRVCGHMLGKEQKPGTGQERSLAPPAGPGAVAPEQSVGKLRSGLWA